MEPTGGREAQGADLTGTVVDGKYRIVRKIGAGGMGEVWLAYHEQLGKNVAMKVLRRGEDRDLAERFQREARAIQRVKHDNVVVVFGSGEVGGGGGKPGGFSYIAMELLEGRTLGEKMRRHGPLPIVFANDTVLQVARALGAAHASGIVHRDVKPENVFLVDNPQGRVKLLDFGIARARVPGDTLTATGTFVGTLAYAAPEAILGTSAVNTAGDLYSVGVVWWEMLTGRRLFEGGSGLSAIVRKTAEDAPRASTLARVPPATDDLVARCLERDPAKRPTVDILIASLSDAGGVSHGGDLVKTARSMAEAAASAVASASSLLSQAQAKSGPMTTPPRGTPVMTTPSRGTPSPFALRDREPSGQTPSSPSSPSPSSPGSPASTSTFKPSPGSGSWNVSRPGAAYESAWVRMDLDAEKRVVRMTRTAKRINDTELDAALACFYVEPRSVDAGSFGVILDSRAPVGRAERDFETKATPYYLRLGRFAKIAVLVRTQIGKMQLLRVMKDLHAKTLITEDELAAVAWVTGKTTGKPG